MKLTYKLITALGLSLFLFSACEADICPSGSNCLMSCQDDLNQIPKNSTILIPVSNIYVIAGGWGTTVSATPPTTTLNTTCQAPCNILGQGWATCQWTAGTWYHSINNTLTIIGNE